jgi:hypothetical protein
MSLPPPAIWSRAADGAGAEDDVVDAADLGAVEALSEVVEEGAGAGAEGAEAEDESVVDGFEAAGAAAGLGFEDGSSSSVGMFSSLSSSGSGAGSGWSTLSARWGLNDMAGNEVDGRQMGREGRRTSVFGGRGRSEG